LATAFAWCDATYRWIASVVPLNSTGPIGRNVTGASRDASTTASLTRISPGRAYSPIRKEEHHAITQPFDRSAAMQDRRPLDEPRQALGELGRHGVTAFLRETCEPGDVQEAHRRPPLQPLLHARSIECAGDRGDDVGRQCVALLCLVDRNERVGRHFIEPRRDLGRPPAEVVLRQALLHHRLNDLASPPLRLALGHPPEAVPIDAQGALDGNWSEPLSQLELHQRHDIQLVLSNSVVRARRRPTDSIPDRQQQVQWDGGPFAQLLERIARQR
jgi:hypothetical protein